MTHFLLLRTAAGAHLACTNTAALALRAINVQI